MARTEGPTTSSAGFTEAQMRLFLDFGHTTSCFGTCIAEATYDRYAGVLKLRFVKGTKTYSCAPCSPELALDFGEAPSKGIWWAENRHRFG